jgi:hypothetical protein
MNDQDAQIFKERMVLAAQQITDSLNDQTNSRRELAQSAFSAVFHPDKPVIEEMLCDWIASAMVGQAIVYHEGMLLRDRTSDVSDLNLKDRNRLHAVARRAWIACELGLVHLFSQKISEGRYRYLAMRSSTHLTPPEIRSRLKSATPTNHAN